MHSSDGERKNRRIFDTRGRIIGRLFLRDRADTVVERSGRASCTAVGSYERARVSAKNAGLIAVRIRAR